MNSHFFKTLFTLCAVLLIGATTSCECITCIKSLILYRTPVYDMTSHFAPVPSLWFIVSGTLKILAKSYTLSIFQPSFLAFEFMYLPKPLNMVDMYFLSLSVSMMKCFFRSQ